MCFAAVAASPHSPPHIYGGMWMAKSSPEIDLCVCAQGQNPEWSAHVQHIKNDVDCTYARFFKGVHGPCPWTIDLSLEVEFPIVSTWTCQNKLSLRCLYCTILCSEQAGITTFPYIMNLSIKSEPPTLLLYNVHELFCVHELLRLRFPLFTQPVLISHVFTWACQYRLKSPLFLPNELVNIG
jgi:hypothetical protein